MGVIFRLPEEVSGKIAAGEVIEGPFSVVRELLDNSLDGGAKHIGVWILNGGKDSIRVADDGCGMSGEDALLAVEKHATSKIRSIEDLENLGTMGFRGEALSSMCAVSSFTMLTRQAEDGMGTRVRVLFGKEVQHEPAAANTGTEVTVNDLFANLPARRKFLKTERAEGARVKDEVLKKSLSFFETGFVYKSDERLVLSLVPRSDRVSRIGEIYGADLERNLIEFLHRDQHFSYQAFVSNRHHTLSNRSGQFIFVNGRPVEDRTLLFAVNNPARGIVPAGRFVYAFVFIEIDPALVDVNVHPAKKEMRIKVERSVQGALHEGASKALSQHFYPTIGLSPQGRADRPEAMWTVKEGYADSPESAPPPRVALGPGSECSGDAVPPAPCHQTAISSASLQGVELPFFQGEIPEQGGLLFRGTLFGVYCIFESPTSFLVLDQHAAHERVLYERYAGYSSPGGPLKGLLVPINVTPPRARYGELLESAQAMREAGFEIEPFGDDSVNIVSVPAFIPDGMEEEAAAVLVEDFCDGRLGPDPDQVRDRFLKLAACRGAVKEGDRLGEAEARRLLDDLRKTRVPYVCPHGRPTCLTLTRECMERAFGRR